MKLNLLIKKLSVCVLSCAMAFAAFIPAVFATSPVVIVGVVPGTFEDIEPPLSIAAQQGDLEKVKQLLTYGANVNCTDELGWTPLHWAASEGCSKVIKFLIEIGANVDFMDNQNQTPLYVAIEFDGSLEDVKYLVEKCHADVNCRNIFNETPLSLAKHFKQEDIVEFLINHGVIE